MNALEATIPQNEEAITSTKSEKGNNDADYFNRR